MLPKKLPKTAIKKRRARSIWQRTRTPDSRKIYNQTSNKLKSKLQEMRNESFEKYVSNLKREDNSIWKPVKIGENPKQHHPQYTNIQHLRDLGQKAELFVEHLSEFFSPHNNDQDQEAEQDLATPIQLQERLKTFTLQEIKDEIKISNQKKALGLHLITSRMVKIPPNKGLVNLMYVFNGIL